MIFGVSGGKTAQELAQLLGTDVDPLAIEAAYKAAFVPVNSEYVDMLLYFDKGAATLDCACILRKLLV